MDRPSEAVVLPAAPGTLSASDPQVSAAVDRFFTLLQTFLSSVSTPSPTILFEIRGMSHFFMVDGPTVRRLPPNVVETGADCRVSCSLDTLVGLVSGSLKPSWAIMRGLLVVTGERKAFKVYGGPLRRAAKKFLDEMPETQRRKWMAATSGGGGQVQQDGKGELLLLGREGATDSLFVSRDDWEEDSSRKRCALCSKAFTVSRRRHHCRMCGFIFCNACSDQRLLGKRVCSKCCDLMLHTYVTTNAHPASSHTPTPSDVDTHTHTGVYTRAASASVLSRASSVSSEGEGEGSSTSSRRGSAPAAPSAGATAMRGGRFSFDNNTIRASRARSSSGATNDNNNGPTQDDSALTAGLSNYTTRAGVLLDAIQAQLDETQSGPIGWAEEDAGPAVDGDSSATNGKGGSKWRLPSLQSLSLSLPLFWVHRGLRIYSAATVVIGVYLALWRYCKMRKYDEATSKEVYVIADRWLAPWVCRQFMELRSVFVKFGQYVGGRSDVVPDDWAKSLALLQDQLPPDRGAYVRHIVSSELRRPFDQTFSAFNFTPIASASVAQVHKATLHDGQEVVVKVQHRGVDELMRSDMIIAIRIATLVAWLNSEFQILLHVMTSWADEMEKELDFRMEASNLDRVRENLRRAGIDVIVPQPIENMVAKRVFVMEFIEGFKITDTTELDRYQVDRRALMERVAQAFSQQFFVDGFFNADPHAGNVMVSVYSPDKVLRPVLLDFGMTVDVPVRRRMAYSKLVFSASCFDMLAAAEALRDIGYSTSQSDEHPERDVEFFQFLLRDTGSRADQKEGAEAFMKRRKLQRENDAKTGNVKSRFMKEIPSEMFFLFRMLGLIRGLCTTLDVKLPYLDIMAMYAQKSLVLAHDEKVRAHRLVPLPVLPPTPVEVKLRHLLLKLCHSRQAIGIQVCVYRRGRVLLDVCGGVLGAVDPQPVTTQTLFPILDLSNLLTALLLHAYARDRTLSYDATLRTYLPWMRDPSMSAITVRHLLAHAHGLNHAVPSTKTPSEIINHKAALDAIATTKPAFAPGSKAVQSLVVKGHLAAALVREHCAVELPIAFQERLVRPLKIQGEAYLGIPSSMPPPPSDTVAKVHNGFIAQVKHMLGGALGFSTAATTDTNNPTDKPSLDGATAAGDSAEPNKSAEAGPASDAADARGDDSDAQRREKAEGRDVTKHSGGSAKDGDEAVGGGSDGGGATSGSGSGSGSDGGDEDSGGGNKGDAKDGAEANELLSRVLLHPPMVNSPRVQSALCPSVNGLATARALARAMDAVGGGTKIISRHQQAMLRRVVAVEDCPLNGRRRWGLGMQVSEEGVLGHEAFGGSCALLFPQAQVSIGITVNNLTIDKTASRQVLRFLARELALPLPEFVRGGM